MNLGDMNINNRMNSQNTSSVSAQTSINPNISNQNAALSQKAYLSNLKSGDTLSGTLSGRDGDLVTISLKDGTEINAKLDNSLSLEIGKPVTLEVRRNSDTLVLSPLFQNTANTTTVSTALEMAGLPVNQTTITLTNTMMSEGLSVNKSNLTSAYSALNSLSGATIRSIVDMQKLGVSYTQNNLNQIDQYKNLSYEIESGLDEIADRVNKDLLGLIEKGDTINAGRIYSQLLDFAQNMETNNPFANSIHATNSQMSYMEQETLVAESDTSPNSELSDAATKALALLSSIKEDNIEDMISKDAASNLVDNSSSNHELQGDAILSYKELIQNGALSLDNLSLLGDSLKNSLPENTAILSHINEILQDAKDLNPETGLHFIQSETEAIPNTSATLQGTSQSLQNTAVSLQDSALPLQDNLENRHDIVDPFLQLRSASEDMGMSNIISTPSEKLSEGITKAYQELFGALKNALDDAIAKEDTSKVSQILSNSILKNNVFAALKQQWTISPDKVAQKEEVEKLYNKLSNQLQQFEQTLTNSGLKNSPAMENTQNLRGNLDFMNQVNQLFSFVQLPIRLSDHRNAHGDLYVYANKRRLSSKEGQVSALLHLDMEHLGPLDVYISMNKDLGNKINTNFTVADEDTLDLLNEHMDELTARLEKKGYQLSCQLTRKDSQDKFGDSSMSSTSGIGPLLTDENHIKLAEYSFDVRT